VAKLRVRNLKNEHKNFVNDLIVGHLRYKSIIVVIGFNLYIKFCFITFMFDDSPIFKIIFVYFVIKVKVCYF